MTEQPGNPTRREGTPTDSNETSSRAAPPRTRRDGTASGTSSGTRREGNDQARTGTRREGNDKARTGTRRDAAPGNAAASTAPTAPATRVNLPHELARDYEIVRLLGAGGEGYALLVRNRAGTQFVAKLYLPSIRFDERVMRLLQRAERDHVVTIHVTGTAQDDGSRYEILEWCEHGSLGDLIDRKHPIDLRRVVSEVSRALEHIHALRLPGDDNTRLIHQDIKPDNLLVRSIAPELDLALGDFGLARLIEGSRHLTDRHEGSRAYAPPSGEAITTGWDWWSLGMVVATLAAGQHPFSAGDRMLPDAAISDLLSQGPVDLSGITDERVRLLCQGLLTRRTTDRWGAPQVREWLTGGSPPVAADRAPIAAGGGAAGAQVATQTVAFAGSEHSDPRLLARALLVDWDQAQERIIQRSDPGLRADLLAFMNQRGLGAHTSLLDDRQSPPPTAMAKLLVALDPTLPPLFRGTDVRPAAIAARLADPAQAAEEVARILAPNTGYLATGILGVWRTLPEMADAVATQDALTQARDLLRAREQDVARAPEPSRTLIRAHVFGAATTTRDEVHAELEHPDAADARTQTWWAALATAGSTDRFAGALARAMITIAAEQTRTARREAEAAAEQRRQQERAAAAARREAAAAAAAEATKQDIRRRWLTDRKILTFWLLSILTIVPALGLGTLLSTTTLPAEGSAAYNWIRSDDNTLRVALYRLVTGATALTVLTGLVLLARWRPRLRRRGMLAGGILLVGGIVGAGFNQRLEDTIFFGGPIDEPGSGSVESNVEPVDPRSAGHCTGTDYWTNANVRTLVTDGCLRVTQYQGWQPRWVVDPDGGGIWQLVSVRGVFITNADDGNGGTVLTAIADDSRVLWTKACPVGWYLDTSLQDAGSDTPAVQTLGLDCGGLTADIDPYTGEEP
jgi:hypothetical protein